MEINSVVISNKGLEQFNTILKDWIPKNASIALACEDSYIHYSPSIEHMHLTLNEKIHPESVAARVIQTRMKSDIVVDSSILGYPYFVIGYPIYLDQKIAALIIIFPSTYTPEKKEPYRFLTGKQEDTWVPVPVEEITYIESLQKRTWFYANNELFKTNFTLKELESRLPEFFIRIHRSYILNIYFIKNITKDITTNFIIQLKSGIELPVSQSYINDLRKVLEF
ncbi:LytR/AlgR family response regulator transcription factor [Ureibacillus thermophilus]|uniref:LytR/AlgR family response regulator transcription factor n=1 Tax=Ureibacillus thermophilus TaxID=367743 RepID=UPI001FE6509C|nr:LytTR family DNA-binding domain-containing protein [Ureibacillus thermophilus]